MVKNIFGGGCFIMAIAINGINTCIDLSIYDAIDSRGFRFLQYGRADGQSRK